MNAARNAGLKRIRMVYFLKFIFADIYTGTLADYISKGELYPHMFNGMGFDKGVTIPGMDLKDEPPSFEDRGDHYFAVMKNPFEAVARLNGEKIPPPIEIEIILKK
ncbi:MAG TPA: hypothetical protein PKC28_16190 [Bdellovibrionales bacterium]|nr:hypothetical protein [Bdellovibrionales bacterium]